MSNYKKRMKKELDDLGVRINALGRFTRTKAFEALSKHEKTLLIFQQEYMNSYFNILDVRVAALDD